MMDYPGIVNAISTGITEILNLRVEAIWESLAQSALPILAGDFIGQMQMAIIVAGLVVGFFVGLTGVGGGTLITPLLILLGVRPITAVGTDLLYASVTKLAGAQQHWKKQSIDWQWVLYLALGSIPASLAATVFLHEVAVHYGAADQLVRWGLGIVLLLSAVLTLINEFYWKRHRDPTDEKHFAPQQHPIKIILIGIVVGIMTGLTSLGSGSIVAVALVALSRLSATKIVGTNIAHGLVLLSASTAAHWQIGTVDVALAANLIIGSLPGVVLGSRMAYFVPAGPLKVGMGFLVLLGGMRMFFTI